MAGHVVGLVRVFGSFQRAHTLPDVVVYLLVGALFPMPPLCVYVCMCLCDDREHLDLLGRCQYLHSHRSNPSDVQQPQEVRGVTACLSVFVMPTSAMHVVRQSLGSV